jgi:hypothetical protein
MSARGVGSRGAILLAAARFAAASQATLAAAAATLPSDRGARTEAGTHLVADIAAGPESSNPGLVTFGGLPFFTVDDDVQGREPRTSDGTTGIHDRELMHLFGRLTGWGER